MNQPYQEPEIVFQYCLLLFGRADPSSRRTENRFLVFPAIIRGNRSENAKNRKSFCSIACYYLGEPIRKREESKFVFLILPATSRKNRSEYMKVGKSFFNIASYYTEEPIRTYEDLGKRLLLSFTNNTRENSIVRNRHKLS